MTPRRAALIGAMMGAIGTLTAAAGPQPLKFYGYAYDLGSNRYLYTEVHDQRVDGERWLGGTIAYYAADGTRLGRKTLDFSQDPYVPVYRFEMDASGYLEAIFRVDERVYMRRRLRRGEELKETAVPRLASMCADSGFHALIRARFDELMSGRALHLQLAAAGSLDSYKFVVRRVDDGLFEGRAAVRLRVEPDSVLRWFVAPLELRYAPAQRRLLEYRGLSNIPDPASGRRRDVRIAYYAKPPNDVPVLPALEP
ncbi:hypothetical protein [Solimonas variicoloris]|uniref:hypothetical protein n=1 Tax=Solimonas variicoloris TaxID=254408 RepID=UPI000380EC14|nr:hypothetical protein [Solimonas variicoloris]